MGSAAIKVSGLSKRFRQMGTRRPVRALEEVDLQIEPGEIVAVLGHNGAGKTTLLKILATLILPDSGDAWVGGVSVTADATRAKASLALLIADDRSFYARLTCRQNLRFFAALSGFSEGAAREKIAQAAELLGLADLDCAYQECSTGFKQRLALARCLMTEAPLLLLDEPTRSLDPASAIKLRRTLKEDLRAKRERTILFTTHQPQEAEELADRIVILDAGRIRTS